jgi:hypothetical protein
MQSSAAITSPLSHSQTFQPLRAAECQAHGTGLGTQPLVRQNVSCSPPHGGLVREHHAERGPTRVKDGLRHPRAGQRPAIHVTYANQSICAGDARGDHMQEVPPLRGDLPVYVSSQSLAPGPLRAGKLGRRLTDMARVADLLACRERGQRAEPEIDADLTNSGGQIGSHLAHKIKEPSSCRILAETARPDVLWHCTGQPDLILPSEESDYVTLDLQRSIALEWNPAKRPPRAATNTPTRLMPSLVPADGELLAHRLHGVAVQSKLLGASRCQVDQIEAGWPTAVQPTAIVLDAATVIPDLVYRYRHAIEILTSGRVFHAVSECQQHTFMLRSGTAGGKRHRAQARPAIPPRPEGRGFSRRIR